MKQKQKIITGRRKTAIARIRVKPGTGKILCNGVDYKDYFKRKTLAAVVLKPLEATGKTSQYDILANLSGGGLSGQAGALRYSIARAIDDLTPSLRKTLKSQGLLTRDSRKVQRKLYGHKKARKSFQFSKR